VKGDEVEEEMGEETLYLDPMRRRSGRRRRGGGRQLEGDDGGQLEERPQAWSRFHTLGWRFFSHAWIDVFRGVIHSNTRTAKCDFRPSMGAQRPYLLLR